MRCEIPDHNVMRATLSSSPRSDRHWLTSGNADGNPSCPQWQARDHWFDLSCAHVQVRSLLASTAEHCYC